MTDTSEETASTGQFATIKHESLLGRYRADEAQRHQIRHDRIACDRNEPDEVPQLLPMIEVVPEAFESCEFRDVKRNRAWRQPSTDHSDCVPPPAAKTAWHDPVRRSVCDRAGRPFGCGANVHQIDIFSHTHTLSN